MDVEIVCPYCGERTDSVIDLGGGRHQRYIEDCSVCCQPIELTVDVDPASEPAVDARRLDE